MSSTGNDTRRIGTRASNSSKHPGLLNKPPSRRTTAEVKAAASAKETAKKAKKEAHDAHIQRVAEFESKARANEELADATPRPNFAPRVTNPDSDVSDGHPKALLVQTRESDDSDSDKPAETPVPKGKKKKGIPVAKTKELASIPESSGDESEPITFVRRRLPKGVVLEETDSDGFAPPFHITKAKHGRIAGEAPDKPEVEEEKGIPPLKRAKTTKVANDEVEVEKLQAEAGKKKKKGSVREAIAAVQQATSADSRGQEEQRDDVEKKSKAVSTGVKRFGDGPSWNPRGEGEERRGEERRGEETQERVEEKEGGSFIKRPNQNKDQIGLPGDATWVNLSFFFLSSIMLTLDPTTLFYWSLSDPPAKKMKYSVESWAKSIPSRAASRSTSHANSVKTGKTSSAGKRPGSESLGTAPALMSSRSQAASSASILTSAITISNEQVPESVKIKQDPDAIYSYDGGLSDNDEITGIERDAAHASPIKGKKRLNSEVS